MTDSSTYAPTPRVSTGIAGLDRILHGGYPAQRLILIEGDPGSGKTTLSMQFLLEGAKRGETVLYVTLSESHAELKEIAASHHWSLEGVHIHEMMVSEEMLRPESQYTIFHPSEVELSETTLSMLNVIDELAPSRLVFDSLSEMRLLAQNPLRYRRQILALKQFLSSRHCTVLLLDNRLSTPTEQQLKSIAHGVIVLDQVAPVFGADRRRMRVLKMRGMQYAGGYHDMIIQAGGLEVFPRLIAAESRRSFEGGRLLSNIEALDTLTGGGLDYGTSTLLMGPAGVGKSTLSLLYALRAIESGERAAVFVFDEGLDVLKMRAASLGFDIEHALSTQRLHLRQIDPAEMAPGEFAQCVRWAVEQFGVRVLIIDSLTGYMNAMPEEQFLNLQLHELLSYTNQHGVVTLLILAQHGVIGETLTPIDTSYLTDAIILLRYFEAAGELRQTISMIKKRGGNHERSIREMRLTAKGVFVGEPLDQYVGVMTGVPTLDIRPEALLDADQLR